MGMAFSFAKKLNLLKENINHVDTKLACVIIP